MCLIFIKCLGMAIWWSDLSNVFSTYRVVVVILYKVGGPDPLYLISHIFQGTWGYHLRRWQPTKVTLRMCLPMYILSVKLFVIFMYTAMTDIDAKLSKACEL